MRPASCSAVVALIMLLACAALTAGHPGDDHSHSPTRRPRQCTSTCADCVLTPEATEGPYYWSNLFMRQNITEGHAGVPLSLYITVVEVSTCTPIQNAAVDIWHADASGTYSHFVSGAVSASDTTTFCRGVQLSSATGLSVIGTVFPGFYVGRTGHIHIKVHIGGQYNSTAYNGNTGHVSHTGQLFFNQSVQDAVYALQPYASHLVTRTTNAEDGIYNGSDGSATVLSLQFVDSSLGYSGGLIGYLNVGVNSTDTPSAVGAGSGATTGGTTTTAGVATTGSTTSAATSTAVASVPALFASFLLAALLS